MAGQDLDADLDTLATALYVRTADLLLESPDLAPWRPAVGITPKLSDAELVTLSVMQALLGFTSERRFIRHAHARLRHLFPYLPKAPGYNKRLRKAAGAPSWPAGPSTDTAPPIPASSGACGSTWCAPCTVCRWRSR